MTMTMTTTKKRPTQTAPRPSALPRRVLRVQVDDQVACGGRRVDPSAVATTPHRKSLGWTPTSCRTNSRSLAPASGAA